MSQLELRSRANLNVYRNPSLVTFRQVPQGMVLSFEAVMKPPLTTAGGSPQYFPHEPLTVLYIQEFPGLSLMPAHRIRGNVKNALLLCKYLRRPMSKHRLFMRIPSIPECGKRAWCNPQSRTTSPALC